MADEGLGEIGEVGAGAALTTNCEVIRKLRDAHIPSNVYGLPISSFQRSPPKAVWNNSFSLSPCAELLLLPRSPTEELTKADEASSAKCLTPPIGMSIPWIA